MPTLSVVIPALDEENGVRETVEQVLALRPVLAAPGNAGQLGGGSP